MNIGGNTNKFVVQENEEFEKRQLFVHSLFKSNNRNVDGQDGAVAMDPQTDNLFQAGNSSQGQSYSVAIDAGNSSQLEPSIIEISDEVRVRIG